MATGAMSASIPTPTILYAGWNCWGPSPYSATMYIENSYPQAVYKISLGKSYPGTFYQPTTAPPQAYQYSSYSDGAQTTCTNLATNAWSINNAVILGPTRGMTTMNFIAPLSVVLQ
jgi:hypothetical protein